MQERFFAYFREQESVVIEEDATVGSAPSCCQI